MTTHVFIVDSITFKFHLEYMFAGTGAGEMPERSNGTLRKSGWKPKRRKKKSK